MSSPNKDCINLKIKLVCNDTFDLTLRFRMLGLKLGESKIELKLYKTFYKGIVELSMIWWFVPNTNKIKDLTDCPTY